MSTNVIDTGRPDGFGSSIVFGADGLPVIAHFDAENNHLWATHCDDSACGSFTTTLLDANGRAGWSSMAIGADSLPVIVALQSGIQNLRVTFCKTASCT